MSIRMTDWTPGTACLDLVCPRCEAKPGQRCTTISGHPTEPHASRWNPLATAYGNGYSDGQRDEQGIAARRAARTEATS